jgi:glycosyltransferase
LGKKELAAPVPSSGATGQADYELMLKFLVKHKITTAYIPEIMVKMRSGGMSNASLKKRLLANRNDRLAWKVNGLRPYPWTLYLKPLRKVGQYIFNKC